MTLNIFFMLFCRLLSFFQYQLFGKFLSGPSDCQTDWIQIRPDILSMPDLGPKCLQKLLADDAIVGKELKGSQERV